MADARDIASDRALGALLGGALGDALGMPTQTLSRAEIAARWGAVDGFLAAPADHPVSRGLPAGAITDDTEQTLLLARRLIADRGRPDPRAWAGDLLAWEAQMRARGLSDLLGPSTKRALAALLAGGDPAETGRRGDTNGAAMRIAPVGIATPPAPLSRLVDAVEAASRVTHGTAAALAAAAAVAAAVSVGVAGGDFAEAAAAAAPAAEAAAARGADAAASDVAERIDRALALARGPDAREAIAAQIGLGVAARESVPAAFGLAALAGGDAWAAGLLAAGLGDDADTTGAIAGALCGACAGAAALPPAAVATVTAVNRLDLAPLVAGLLALRAAA